VLANVDPGLPEGTEPVSDGAFGGERVRVGGHDDPDVGAPPACLDDAPDDRPIREVWVDHVQAAAGPGDGLMEGGRDRQMSLARVVEQDLHLGPRARRQLREEPVEAVARHGHRPALHLP
jgi:hypothetical protein